MITQNYCFACKRRQPHQVTTYAHAFEVLSNVLFTIATLGIWFPFWFSEAINSPDMECQDCKTASYSISKKVEIGILSVVFVTVLLFLIPLIYLVMRTGWRFMWWAFN